MILDGSIRRVMKPDRPEWLIGLQNDLALLTADESQKHWPDPANQGSPYYNYRLEQIQQVERDALRLAETIPADADILLAGVWIYDRCGGQQPDDPQADCAADWARQHLAEYGFPAAQVEAAALTVAGQNAPPGELPDRPIEARLLWDADKLAIIGPLNIVNYLTAHPAHPSQRLSYTGMALYGLEQLDRARRLIDCLYFEVSRHMARRRYEQQKMFYEALASDVEV
jgi:hypothetical protein